MVASEIRELSKETLESAKKVDVAAREINKFLSSIVASSEDETNKVVEGGNTVKAVCDNMSNVAAKINANYGFTQKIDVSIKQQETGSVQAAETMREMAEIVRQSAETARHTMIALKNVAACTEELEKTVNRIREEKINA